MSSTSSVSIIWTRPSMRVGSIASLQRGVWRPLMIHFRKHETEEVNGGDEIRIMSLDRLRVPFG